MYDAETWPIACKVNFGPLTEEGLPIMEAPIEVWSEQLWQIADLGFKHIDPMDDWINVADLDERGFERFQKVLAVYDLSVAGISVGRNSVIDPMRGEENVRMVERLIERAPTLGADIVNIGFQQELLPAQKDALWFWLADGYHDPESLRSLAIERVRHLADRAERVGIELSLEIYEDTFCGTPEGAVEFLTQVDHPAVGINPDIGNLIRLHRPMPSYREMYETVLPYANYWHIKNYLRDEDPGTGAYFSAPVPLEYGVVDYRFIIRQALRLGYRGAFMTEHYGSDWLGVGAQNARYIRGVLRQAEALIKRVGADE